MRLLVTGDWHPDYKMMGHSRFDEVERAATQTVDYAIANHVDCYVFLGDLANPDTGGDSYRAVRLLIAATIRLLDADKRVIIIAGNHDVWTDGTGATTLTPLLALQASSLNRKKFLHVAERPKHFEYRHHRFVLLPYTAPSHAYDPEEFVKALPKSRPHVIFGHLMIPGIHPGSETKDMPRGRAVMFPLEATNDAKMRFNGHYHRQQVFETPEGVPIRIPGSICRLAFGEESNTPSFLVVDL